ncbi:NRDE family protein [Bacillaceae bacterium S4-13-58]
MCLILLAKNIHPDYPLIVAANRDEFYKRPTESAHFWEDHPYILAGRDLEKMGTWMGVTKYGQFAALTNYRDPEEMMEGKKSRGELVANFLKTGQSPETYLSEISQAPKDYPGYNLLVGNSEELFYFSNKEKQVRNVEKGIHGLSNHLFNTDWPKVKKGKEGLREILKYDQSQTEMVKNLFGLLEYADPASDEDLPQTGVPIEWERVLSPLFIKTENYGTRSSTVLLMSQKEIHFYEKVHDQSGTQENSFSVPVG